MKYNLRTLKGKRIVGGDPNLATKNEVHITKVPQELGIEGGKDTDSTKYYLLNRKVDLTSPEEGELKVIYLLVISLATLVRSARVSGLGGNMGHINIAQSLTFLNLLLGESVVAANPEGFAISSTYFGTLILNTEKDPNLVVDEGCYVGKDFKDALYANYIIVGNNIPDFNIIPSKEDFFRYYDEFMSTYCVEVTKEQFFDFNYTLIKE